MSILSDRSIAVHAGLLVADRLGLVDDEFDELKGEQDDEYRPTADEAYNPTELDEAEWCGTALRLSGEPMAELVTNSTALLLRFAIGQSLGLELRLKEEQADHDEIQSRDARFVAWLDEHEPRETDGYAPGYYS
jgi:hypothetical protein